MKRLCASCGKLVRNGMTDEIGGFYTHEGQCFIKYMNNKYGKHKWMKLGADVEDEYGGYYIRTASNERGFDGTGIYYTEWEDD